jgi:hypothetical protein
MEVDFELDRGRITPTLLRTFCWQGEESALCSRYDLVPIKFPSAEAYLYVWPDASAREIAEMVKTVYPAAKVDGVTLHFTLVFPDFEGQTRLRRFGQVVSDAAGPGDETTLMSVGFEAGDYLDVRVAKQQQQPAASSVSASSA